FALGLLFVLQFASGYPPLVLLGMGLCCGLLVAWTASHLTARSKAHVQRGGDILPRGWPGTVLVTGTTSLALAAVYLLPFRETTSLSVHGRGLPYEEVVRLSGSWRTFARLIAPNFFGGNYDTRQWSILYGPYEEVAYIGLLAVVLALGAPLLARRQSAVPYLWALLPMAAILALGANTPLYRWLYERCVLLRLTRIPVRWMELWFLAAPLLAGFAFDASIHRAAEQRSRSARRYVPMALGILAAIFVATAIALTFTSPHDELWMQTAQWNRWRVMNREPEKIALYLRQTAIREALITAVLAFLAAWFWLPWQRAPNRRLAKRAEHLLIALVVLDVLILCWRWNKVVTPHDMSRNIAWPAELVRQFQPGDRWTTVVGLRAPNQAVLHRIDLYNGYDVLGSRRYFQFASTVEGEPRWDDVYQPIKRSPLLRVAGVTHTLTTRPELFSPASNISETRRAGKWILWKHPAAWPRLYLTRRVERVAEPQQLSRLQALATQPGSRITYPVVVAREAFDDVRLSTKAIPSDKILAWRRDLNRATIETQCTAPTILVQSEALSPGWRAWINAQPAPVQPANFLFRAVRVPAGRAHVAVVYDTQTYRFALFVSLCGLAAVALLIVMKDRAS
ncbi:MAG: hypothetical protein M3347_17365, partial [Armatimonadota bacterium]|nr:hypothetical protein [Armatimonadota bacterium]